ncbi:MAG: hypothetical protein HKL99_15230 [Burkholderiales bacterium]|nr:hypothetical protein [Burkholderiales bacterium]
MDILSQVIPALIILAANLLGGTHGSRRWEVVTAIFGWTALFGLIASILTSMITRHGSIAEYLWQITGFSLITALSRDYEKILHPIFNRK